MLVSRGACSFADKAATLQAANVSLAIVFNNAPGACASVNLALQVLSHPRQALCNSLSIAGM